MNISATNGALLWNIRKIVSKGDYNYAVVPEHPKRTKNNYILEHRAVMENYLGRLLNTNEVIHHIDEDKKNNNIYNLQLLTASEHIRLHQSVKGETMLELICPNCSNVFSRSKNKTHIGKGKGTFTACSNSCRGKFSRLIQLQGRTEQVESAISVNILREYNSLDNTEGTHLQETP